MLWASVETWVGTHLSGRMSAALLSCKGATRRLHRHAEVFNIHQCSRPTDSSRLRSFLYKRHKTTALARIGGLANPRVFETHRISVPQRACSAHAARHWVPRRRRLVPRARRSSQSPWLRKRYAAVTSGTALPPWLWKRRCRRDFGNGVAAVTH